MRQQFTDRFEAVGHFLPEDDPQAISGVIKPRWLNPDNHAQHIAARFFQLLPLVKYRLLGVYVPAVSLKSISNMHLAGRQFMPCLLRCVTAHLAMCSNPGEVFRNLWRAFELSPF